MRNVSLELPAELPDAAMQVFVSDVAPKLAAWAETERLDFAEDVSHCSCQRHENRVDWVFKVHRMDGRCKVFPIMIGAVH